MLGFSRQFAVFSATPVALPGDGCTITPQTTPSEAHQMSLDKSDPKRCEACQEMILQ